MATDERTRHLLHQRLEEVLGPEEAATLMEQLPPVGWADVATKRDLENLRLDIRAELHAELSTLQWRVVTWVTGLNVALVGLVFAAARLA